MLRAITRWVGLVAIVGWIIAAAGCTPASNPPAPTTVEDSEGDGHDHSEEEGHEHAHPSEGPHHGHLIELGSEEYHAELTHDDVAESVTIYILDSSAEKAVAIAEPEITVNMTIDGSPQQFKLAAAPQEDDPEGKSSRFELADEALYDAVEGGETGRLNVTIAGKPYVGDIEDLAHDHDGEHSHDEP
jgi:hypothetical protein